MKLLWKLLRQNISKPQLIGFFFANLIGLSIVLLAVQFYFDINPLVSGKDNLFKKDYVTLTKKVGLLSSLSTGKSGFSDSEIEELKEQTFIKDVGAFSPSQFNVFAGINNAEVGIDFNTQMFFESLPDHFIDVKSDSWNFSPDKNEIPIILPKNYLDLYNFGFAETNSMPKLSESIIGMVGLDISLYGNNGNRMQMRGRIVGFSNRINTILVPESFLQWANASLGNKSVVQPSRLMVEISNVADPNMATYFKSKGYEISGENDAVSKMSFFLKVVVTIVLSVGVIICFLSFFILALSIYLLLEKNMTKLRNLRLIGYSKSTVLRPYQLLVVILNVLTLLISLSVVFVLRAQYLDFISKIYISDHIPFPFYTILIGLGLFLLLSVSNLLIIKRKVK